MIEFTKREGTKRGGREIFEILFEINGEDCRGKKFTAIECDSIEDRDAIFAAIMGNGRATGTLRYEERDRPVRGSFDLIIYPNGKNEIGRPVVVIGCQTPADRHSMIEAVINHSSNLVADRTRY